jgi:branched-chain amino acid transport system ATP-binding protein
VLEVNGLSKRFGALAAVSEVSFRLDEGEILGLIGPNGSGKSTTFNVIAGLYAPSGGSVRFLGEEIGGFAPAAVAHRGIARTFQIPRPFRKLSLLENVALAAFYGKSPHPPRDKAWAMAREALDLVKLPSGAAARVDGLGAAGARWRRSPGCCWPTSRWAASTMRKWSRRPTCWR